MSLNYSNVNTNNVALSSLPFTITATYNQGGTNRNLYEVKTTLSDYDWRRADLKDYALALSKLWVHDPTNSRKKYYVLNSGHDEWPVGTTAATKSTQGDWPDSTHNASEIEGKHVQLNIFCSDDITEIDGFAKPYSFGGLQTRNVIVGFQWNLFGTNPAGPPDDYGNFQPMLNNGFASGLAPTNYWQYIWLPNNHINGNPPAGTDITNHYYLEKIDQLLIDNTIDDFVADTHNNGLTQNTTPTPPPPPTPPEIVNIHFYYNPGSVIDKAGNLDDVSATYEAPLESSSAIFLLEFDKPLDASAITSAPTKPIGIMDRTELSSTGNLTYFNQVSAAGFGFEWWKYYDDVHNLTSTSVGGFTSGLLSDGHLNNNITSNSPMSHCIYVAIPGGVLKAGHEYSIWHIPEYIKGTDNTPMNRYNTGTAFTATWEAGPSLAELLLKIEAPAVDATAPTIVSKTPAPGATNVSVNTPITITFDEELDPATTTGNWTPYPASITYSSKVITVTPSSPLPGTTTINVTAPASITDTSGNALVLPVTWSFTTAAPPDTRVPIEAYAIGFTKDPDNFKSIPLTKSGTITQEFKIPAVDMNGPKIMYLRLRDQDGLISTNYRIALRVLDFELETFEVNTHGYCGGTTNQIDVLFDTDTDPTTMEYGFLVDDSGEPTVWNPVTPLSYDSVGKYKFNFNLDVSVISSGQHDLYVWLRALEGEKKFCKTDFVSEPIPADPYGSLIIKKSMIDGAKKKVWVEANIFDAGVGVSAISFVESTNPASFESINIIQNKRITKLFEYDASANTTNTFNLIIEDAVGRTSALITTSINLSGVY